MFVSDDLSPYIIYDWCIWEYKGYKFIKVKQVNRKVR